MAVAGAAKSTKTWWIVGAVVAVALLFLFLRGRSASGSSLAPASGAGVDPNALDSLSSAASAISVQQIQAQMEAAREAAALEAARIQASTQQNIADTQSNNQLISGIVNTAGTILGAAIPYVFGGGRGTPNIPGAGSGAGAGGFGGPGGGAYPGPSGGGWGTNA